MTRLRLALLSLFLVPLLAIAPPMPSAGAADRSDHDVGPGCDPARQAVAYHAGGRLAERHD